ncbi:sugar transferase [Actinomarinicola tropica]|nr:sugar transferase [Actinomarinicola tropica]
MPSSASSIDTVSEGEAISTALVADRLRHLQPLDADDSAVRAVRRTREINLSKVAVAMSDTLAFVLAMGVAWVLTQIRVQGDPVSFAEYALVAVLATPVLVAALASRRLYQARFVTRRSDEFRRLADGLLLTVVGMVMIAFLLKVPVSRTWVVVALVISIPALWFEREVVRQFFRRRRVTGRSTRRVVVVGNNGEAAAVVAMLEADRSLGYEVLAVVDGEVHGAPEDPSQPLDLVARTVNAVRENSATGVVVTATAMDLRTSNRLIRVLTHAGLHVELTSALSDVETSRISVRPLGRYPVLYIEPVLPYGWRPIAKRCFDVVVASTALVLLAVPMAVVAALVKITSPGPVLFRQRRLGRGGEFFEVLKFRSMVPDAEARLIDLRESNEADGPLFKMTDDPRVTRIGRFIRRTSIDELPQLWNVIRGEMSLVGPRPALANEAQDWSPELFNRLRVRPGITGMWQVSGRSDTGFDEYTRLDLYYVDNWSLLVDIGIVLRTIPSVLAARGAR